MPPGTQVVQRWHFGMLNDHERNEAFYSAIKTLVRPGDFVLDIGAGTGLLGMMAARAGAGKVVCCEKVEKLAAVAEDIVRANGLAHVVKVVHKYSCELTVGPTRCYVAGAGMYDAPGRDMSGRAHVLVSEIVDCGLLGEGVIPTLVHARRELLAPAARIIPCAARVFATAIECFPQPAPLSRPMTATFQGFDLSALDQFRAPTYEQMRLAELDHRPLTTVCQVLDFDFYSPNLALPRGAWQRWAIAASGTVHAVAFWFELDMDGKGSVLDTSPANTSTCWKQAVQFVDEPIAVAAGSSLPVWVSHDETRISFSLSAPPPPDED